jgi:DNA polymerase-1
MHRLAALGIPVGLPCMDLMIASYLLGSGERRHSLSSILAYNRSVSIEDEAEDVEGRIAQMETALEYFPSLSGEFAAELKKNDLRKLYDTMEAPLIPVLAKMERTGIAVDKAYFGRLSEELGGKIDALTARIHKAAGEEFNINSPAQMKVVLFDRLGISTLGLKRTGKTKELSTAAAELEKLRDAHPIVPDILDYRELAKLKSTYVDALPELVHPKTGRIHAEFNQTVAATGRLSSSNPNLQNIPTPETEYGKRVRDGFVAPKGRVLVAADYSQIELRIAAHIADEKAMITAFKKGEDIHWRTAAEMFGEDQAKDKRRIAKVINFGILYGMGPQRLAESANISFMEAREYIERYFAINKGIAKYMEHIKEQIADDGYVETLFGRRRFFRNVRLMNPRERAEAERQAINMPIQGTNADIIKLAMAKLDALIAEKHGRGEDAAVKIVSQVHDELVFEADKTEVDAFCAEVGPVMSGVAELVVPITVNVSVGERWGSMEKRS